MNEDVEFFRSEIVAYARSLPLSSAVKFLRGALEVGGDHEAMADVRRAFQALQVADDQLELIAVPQSKLGGDGSK